MRREMKQKKIRSHQYYRRLTWERRKGVADRFLYDQILFAVNECEREIYKYHCYLLNVNQTYCTQGGRKTL